LINLHHFYMMHHFEHLIVPATLLRALKCRTISSPNNVGFYNKVENKTTHVPVLLYTWMKMSDVTLNYLSCYVGFFNKQSFILINGAKWLFFDSNTSAALMRCFCLRKIMRQSKQITLGQFLPFFLHQQNVKHLLLRIFFTKECKNRLFFVTFEYIW